jgi:hypothetical protein
MTRTARIDRRALLGISDLRDHGRRYLLGDGGMPRLIACVVALVVGLSAGAAFAQSEMKPTAPVKMMPPADKARLAACQQKAAQQHIKMDDRAKFVMDCMKEMAK